MSARDDTPEEGTPGRPRAGRVGGERPHTPEREPEREPFGYYYDDGTNYETYDPEAEEGPEKTDGEAGPVA